LGSSLFQNQINSILSHSKETLEEFIFYEPLGCLSHLKFLELENRVKLVVRVLLGNLNLLPNGLLANFFYQGLLPPNFNFSKNLPRLEHVQLLIVNNFINWTDETDDDDDFFL